jgi:hypothetical protein
MLENVGVFALILKSTFFSLYKETNQVYLMTPFFYESFEFLLPDDSC